MAENVAQAKEIADLTSRARDLSVSMLMLMYNRYRFTAFQLTQTEPIPGLLENINIITFFIPPRLDWSPWLVAQDMSEELAEIVVRLKELGIDWQFEPDLQTEENIATIWNEHHDAEHQYGNDGPHHGGDDKRRVEAPNRHTRKRKHTSNR